jgi:hypothetical protein
MIRFLVIILSTSIYTSSYAIQCFFTMVKDSCWKDYNLSVDLINAKTGKNILTVLIPQGQLWIRQPFKCSAGDTLSLQATFNPAFWESDADKVYSGQHYWGLPKVLQEGEVAWNVTICYPKEFSAVPLPPDASGNCGCNVNDIPAVEPM